MHVSHTGLETAASRLTQIHTLHDLDVTVFRYFTVYGPAGRPDMSVFRFIRWVEQGEPVHVFGDGTQRRDFTFVDDIARGTIAGLASVGHEVINLGGNRPASLLEVISMIEGLLGKKANIVFGPHNPLDVPATWANVAKAHDLLGWDPTIGLEEGLASAVDSYSANRDLAASVAL